MYFPLLIATGAETAVLISSLIIGGASIAAQQAMKPGKPVVPQPGLDPGDVPDTESAAIRRILQARRGREALRIDPTPAVTGLQIK